MTSLQIPRLPRWAVCVHEWNRVGLLADWTTAGTVYLSRHRTPIGAWIAKRKAQRAERVAHRLALRSGRNRTVRRFYSTRRA